MKKGLSVVLRATLAGVLLNGAALAETTKTSNYAEHPEAGAVIEALGERGLDTDRVRRLLADAKRQDSILEAIARPAEKSLTWAEYSRIFLTDTRVEQGVQFAREHADTLARA